MIQKRPTDEQISDAFRKSLDDFDVNVFDGDFLLKPPTLTEVTFFDKDVKEKLDYFHKYKCYYNKSIKEKGQQVYFIVYVDDNEIEEGNVTQKEENDDAQQSGYHRRNIPKGTLGQFSKITEEYTELLDAFEQDDKVLQICEMTDLIGAIKHYAKEQFNLELNDLIRFSQSTENAFKNGKR